MWEEATIDGPELLAFTLAIDAESSVKDVSEFTEDATECSSGSWMVGGLLRA